MDLVPLLSLGRTDERTYDTYLSIPGSHNVRASICMLDWSGLQVNLFTSNYHKVVQSSNIVICAAKF